MLTTRDIERLLQKRKWFAGVFLIDLLPRYIGRGKGVIVNLDESFKEGSHWISIYFDLHGFAHYFDSFGRPSRGNILTFIEQSAPNGFTFNKKKL